jgi:hypothetical protein
VNLYFLLSVLSFLNTSISILEVITRPSMWLVNMFLSILIMADYASTNAALKIIF